MVSLRADEPGYSLLSIDGQRFVLPDFVLPSELTPTETMRITQVPLASGGTSIIGVYAGAGMPNLMDSLSLSLPWQIDARWPGLALLVEQIRASGSPHDVSYWKQRVYRYTLAASQQVIYLPRRDAFNAGYAFIESDDAAVAYLNGTALSVVYKTSVTGTETVPATELWVSETPISHPGSGKPNVLRCKTGATIALNDLLEVRYVPLYNMQATQVDTTFPLAGCEDKTLTLIEAD